MADSDCSPNTGDQHDQSVVTTTVKAEKRPCNQEQLDHLARIREKAIVARRKHAEERKRIRTETPQELETVTKVTKPVKSKPQIDTSESSLDSSSDSSSSSDDEPAPIQRTKQSARKTSTKNGREVQERLDRLERHILKMHYKQKYKNRTPTPTPPPPTQQPQSHQSSKNTALSEALAESLKQSVQPRKRTAEFPHPLSKIF